MYVENVGDAKIMCHTSFMALLPFMTDEEFLRATRSLLEAARRTEQRVDANPYRNVIDPFSALVDAARQRISTEEWMSQEKARQVQKGMQNALGDFHQDVLGSVQGWENGGRGGSYDVISHSLGVIAEIKNKFNTMNARSALSVYDNLSRHLDYSSSGIRKAYLVEIIPKNPLSYEVPFHPSERGTSRPERPDIVRIDGKSFYALVSGDERALEKVYLALPVAISLILGIPPETIIDENVFLNLFERVYSTS